ncbi:Spermidine N(1)-acetyltransferase [compost metagenome]
MLLLIALKDNDEVIGDTAIQDMDRGNRTANLRIAIGDPEHQGKGYGREALLLMLDYGFGILNLHRIELEVYTYNKRAAHVYESVGFVREGVRRQTLYYNHEYHDVIVMSMLENEYRERYLR